MNKPIEVYEEMAPNKVRWKYLETDNFINAVKALDEKDCSEEFLEYRKHALYNNLS
ncbi:hypothetical protein [Pedobacter sp. UBA4863]|uniref:hypothetical protein n=1 Tax=Pedobacter sp. UBA4863 TaxID=1947060 RepID=UPI0025DEB8D2|nr:hypothetical protein [Pedobacter sp. UBA4863]